MCRCCNFGVVGVLVIVVCDVVSRAYIIGVVIVRYCITAVVDVCYWMC